MQIECDKLVTNKGGENKQNQHCTIGRKGACLSTMSIDQEHFLYTYTQQLM